MEVISDSVDILYIVDIPVFFLLEKICWYVKVHNYFFQEKLLCYYRFHALLSDNYYLQNTLGALHFESTGSVDELYVVLLVFPPDLIMYNSFNFTACLSTTIAYWISYTNFSLTSVVLF